jgi:hypothetical protein
MLCATLNGVVRSLSERFSECSLAQWFSVMCNAQRTSSGVVRSLSERFSECSLAQWLSVMCNAQRTSSSTPKEPGLLSEKRMLTYAYADVRMRMLYADK